MPPLAIADPEEGVWEAFFVALLNQRYAVLGALLDRGFPVDYLGHGMSALSFAVGNADVPLVEFLLQHGADPELSSAITLRASLRKLPISTIGKSRGAASSSSWAAANCRPNRHRN